MAAQCVEAPAAIKRCTKCTQWKPLTEFHRNRAKKDGLHPWCKACARAQAVAWRNAHPEQARANSRQWAQSNPEKHRENQRELYARDPQRYLERQSRRREVHFDQYTQSRRRAAWMRKYGITPEEYKRLWDSQGGVCAICGAPPHENARGLTWLCVDHDHATGAVRGLLCRRCNRTLGLFDDDAERFARAAEYLRSVAALRSANPGGLE